jgi:hypothetical protein
LLYDSRVFTVAVLFIVSAADKPAFDMDAVAAVQPGGSVFAKSSPRHDAVAPRSERMLLPRRGAAFREGPEGIGEEPEKQRQ